MRIVRLTIQSLEDAAKGEKGIEYLQQFKRSQIIEPKTETIHVCVMEGGMQSGKTSVALSFQLDDGTPVFFELSADMMTTIASGVKSAVERFGK